MNRPARKPFLLGQPIWRLDEMKPDDRWEIGVMEDDPSDETASLPLARMSPRIETERMDRDEADKVHRVAWKRVDRDSVVSDAISAATVDLAQRDLSWHRVALVSSAGLGKSTNLQWLASCVNSIDKGRGSVFAFFIELDQLATSPEGIEKQISNHLIDQGTDLDPGRLTESVRRLLTQGRVLFLLDSLDQADPSPNSPAVTALASLLHGRWVQCPVWVSGRPYAFRIAQPVLRKNIGEHDWRFLRVGLLDEPECRQLLER